MYIYIYIYLSDVFLIRIIIIEFTFFFVFNCQLAKLLLILIFHFLTVYLAYIWKLNLIACQNLLCFSVLFFNLLLFSIHPFLFSQNILKTINSEILQDIALKLISLVGELCCDLLKTNNKRVGIKINKKKIKFCQLVWTVGYFCSTVYWLCYKLCIFVEHQMHNIRKYRVFK